MIEVREIRGDCKLARELLAAMEAEVAAEFGPITPERTSVVHFEELCPPSGTYVIVLEDGAVVAGGALRRLQEGVAEIKRMFTVPSARGRGHGRRLLEALEDAARRLGYERVRLDTAGSMKAALHLYADYEPIPDYNGNSFALFWGEKQLR